MTIITFDIETLPTNDTVLIERLGALIKAPATHKKKETIDKWHEENGADALAKIVAETSFSGLYGRIACLAWMVDDEEVLATDAADTEAQAIRKFYDFIQDYSRFGNSDLTFCGHDIARFDLPFLKHRSIILGIKPPPAIYKAMHAKPWDSCIADTKVMWTADQWGHGSMDKLCYALGIPGKGDFDGSMVAETWPSDPEKVIEYCKDDVLRTRKIYKRLTFSETKHGNGTKGRDAER